MEPWLARLSAGDSRSAWDFFQERYRRLIVATIRRLVRDHDDVMDVFGSVCAALSADDFARLRRYSLKAAGRADAGTWVVAVVRNLTVDWLRQRHGRQRRAVPPGLSPLRQEIYAAICLDGHSHIEAYELLRARTGTAMAFHDFLREVRATHLAAPCPHHVPLRRTAGDAVQADMVTLPPDLSEPPESVERLGGLLATLPPDLRLAIGLFVVEQLPAAEVARVVGWPNAKAVYNRVSRALAQLRADLQRRGIGPDDL